MGTALIIAKKWYPLGGSMVEKQFTFTPSSSYATGGEAITSDTTTTLNTGIATGTAKLMPYINDLTRVLEFRCEPRVDGFTCVLDKTNKKLLIRDNAGAEVANASNQSAKVFVCTIRYFDNAWCNF